MRTVLVTGCSSGIGLETAISFSARGDHVVATMRDLDRAEGLLTRAAAEGLQLEVRQLDVTSEESVAGAVESVIAEHGGVDVVVNNAGVANRGPIETQALDAAQTLMETNFWGPIRVCRAVLPAMRQRGSGVIINVGSLAGRLPATPYAGMYAASKSALAAISEALAGEVKPFGIRVVVIEPGFFATAIADNNLSTQEEIHADYAADAAWVSSYFDSSVEDGANPASVAEAIVQAAGNDAAPLHTPVGEDATLLLALLDGVEGYEGWNAVVIPIVEDSVGPRPTR